MRGERAENITTFAQYKTKMGGKKDLAAVGKALKAGIPSKRKYSKHGGNKNWR